MKIITKRLCLSIFLTVISPVAVFSQENWPSPEVEQMYRNAQDYMAVGNYKDAATTYKQAIKLAPGTIILYRDLGDALYQSGNYDEAGQVLTPLLAKQGADVKCYLLLSKIEVAQKDAKHAISTLKKGIEKFSASGSLYHEKGSIYFGEKKQEDALNAWLDGVSKDPGFSENYFDAANIYLNSDKVFWGIIYGETFLAMQYDSVRGDEMKFKLFKAYKTMFDNFVKDEVPKYGESSKQATANTFEASVQKIFSTLTPVVSDGITTENLTMLRTRFLMEWGSIYGKKYPFSLFSYQDKIIRSGHFDMYNEWLFGKAESDKEYKAWNEFHEGDMIRFLQWKNENKFMPAANEFYNDRDMSGVLDRRKK